MFKNMLSVQKQEECIDVEKQYVYDEILPDGGISFGDETEPPVENADMVETIELPKKCVEPKVEEVHKIWLENYADQTPKPVSLSEEQRAFIYQKIDDLRNHNLYMVKKFPISKLNGLFDNFELYDVINYKNAWYLIQVNKSSLKIKKLSNFVIKIISYTMEHDNSSIENDFVEKNLIELRKEGNPKKVYSIKLSGKDFVDSRALLLKLSETVTGLTLQLTKEEFSDFVFSLFCRVIPSSKFMNGGHDDYFKLHIWSNAIMSIPSRHDFDNKEARVYFENPDTGLIIDDYDDFYSVDTSVKTILPVCSEKFKLDALRQFIYDFNKTYDDSAKIVLGAALGIVYFDIYKEIAEGFPYIGLFGLNQTGKSTLTTCINRIFGYPDNSNVLSGTSTDYAVRYALMKAHNLPVILEDVDKAYIDKLGILCKDIYAQVPRVKGKSDGSISSMAINSGLVFTGNYFFNNPSVALLNRGIFANFSKPNPKLKDFIYHSGDMQKHLLTILPLLLSKRDMVETYYDINRDLLEEWDEKKDRYHNNLAIALTTWDIIEEILDSNAILIDKEAVVKNYLAEFKPYLDCEIPFGDEFIRILSTLINNSYLKYDDVYTLTNGNTIRLNLTKFLPIYNRLYPNKPLTKAYFCMKLNSDERFKLQATGIGDVGRAIFIHIDEDEEILDLIKQKKDTYAKIL